MGLYGLMKDHKIFVPDFYKMKIIHASEFFQLIKHVSLTHMQKSKNNSFFLQVAENLCPMLVYNFK